MLAIVACASNGTSGIGQASSTAVQNGAMAEGNGTTGETLAAFAATLEAMSQSRVDRGGDTDTWNGLVNDLQRLQLNLRVRPKRAEAESPTSWTVRMRQPGPGLPPLPCSGTNRGQGKCYWPR